MNSFWKNSYRAQFLALAAYFAVTIAMTFPLAFRLTDSLLAADSNALNDSYFSIWIFGWQAHQLIADPLNLFQANIFYPFPNTLAFSEIILPGALLYLPFAYASGNPLFAYNIILFLTFPLNAFAMYLYALDWFSQIAHRTAQIQSADQSATRDPRFAAFLAGIIFAFCTYKIGELRHIQLLMSMFMPLTLLYAAKFFRSPNFHNAFFTALFFALNALSSLYYALFLAFALALYIGIELARRRFHLTRQHLMYGIIAAIISGVIVVPFLLPFFRLEREFNFSAERDPRAYSARPASYLATPREQWLYGEITREFRIASKGQPVFPGIVVIALSGIGLGALICQKDRAWVFLILLALMGFILSFGPDLLWGRTGEALLNFPLPYFALAKVVPPLNSLNAPSRFVILTMIALSLLAAYGAHALAQRAFVPGGGKAGGLMILFACTALILLEYVCVPLKLQTVAAGAAISPAYRFLAHQPRDQAVVEIPMGEPTFVDQDKHVEYTYNSLYYLHPLVNGYSTFIPPDYYALVRDVKPFPNPNALSRLHEWGVTWLVIHSGQFERLDAVRGQLDGEPTLEHVRDFGEIWLYRFRR